MLLIPTYLAPSSIHGIGLFAGHRIRRGTVIWRFNQAIDVRLRPDALQSLAGPALSQVESYIYLDNRTKEIILCGDDARFFNHADNPNVIDDIDDPYKCVAARDIEAGEELTQDYFSFDLLAMKKLTTSTPRRGPAGEARALNTGRGPIVEEGKPL